VKVRIKLGSRGGSDAVLLKMAALSAVGHGVLLVVFSVLPRFIAPSPPPRAIIAEVVPASVLLPQPAPSRPPAGSATPSQRAKAARKAVEEASTPPPKPPARKAAPRKEPVPPPPDEPARKEPVKEEQATPAPVVLPEEVQPEPVAPDTEPATIPSGPAPSTGAGISFGGATPGGIPSIGSSLFPYDYYRAGLVSILQSHWRRPVAPDGLPETIQCRVQFTIIKSGIIQDPQIVSPSGNRALDQSALRAVYDSSPLPPLPYQYSGPSVRAEVVFELTPD
jgi:TonB family protein